MDDEILLKQLEEVVAKLGIEVRNENISMEELSGIGGLCRIDGKYILFLHSHASTTEKILVFAKSLRRFDLEDVFMKPAIRELLTKPASPYQE